MGFNRSLSHRDPAMKRSVARSQMFCILYKEKPPTFTGRGMLLAEIQYAQILFLFKFNVQSSVINFTKFNLFTKSNNLSKNKWAEE